MLNSLYCTIPIAKHPGCHDTASIRMKFITPLTNVPVNFDLCLVLVNRYIAQLNHSIAIVNTSVPFISDDVPGAHCLGGVLRRRLIHRRKLYKFIFQFLFACLFELTIKYLKSIFVTTPPSFLSNGGTPCCPFPGHQLSKQSTNSCQIWIPSSSPTVPINLVDD